MYAGESRNAAGIAVTQTLRVKKNTALSSEHFAARPEMKT
jgi:hypothetical protein